MSMSQNRIQSQYFQSATLKNFVHSQKITRPRDNLKNCALQKSSVTWLTALRQQPAGQNFVPGKDIPKPFNILRDKKKSESTA